MVKILCYKCLPSSFCGSAAFGVDGLSSTSKSGSTLESVDKQCNTTRTHHASNNKISKIQHWFIVSCSNYDYLINRLTVGAKTSFVQYSLFGLLYDQCFKSSIVNQRAASRWIAVLETIRGTLNIIIALSRADGSVPERSAEIAPLRTFR